MGYWNRLSGPGNIMCLQIPPGHSWPESQWEGTFSSIPQVLGTLSQSSAHRYSATGAPSPGPGRPPARSPGPKVPSQEPRPGVGRVGASQHLYLIRGPSGSANPWAWGSLGTAAGLGWSASVPWSSAQPLSAPLPSLRQEGRDPPVTHAQKTQDPKFQTGLLGGVRHLAGTMLPPNPAGTRSLCWKPQASPAPELHGSPSKGHSPAFPAASPLDRDQGQIPAGVCRGLGEPKGMSPEEGAGGEEGVLHASESTSPSSKENGRVL